MKLSFSLHRSIGTAVFLFAAFFSLFPLSTRSEILPPPIMAKAWAIVDVTSGQVLAAENFDLRVEPASLTKIMTTYLVFEALKDKRISMEQLVLPSESVRKVGRDESRTFIEVGKPVRVDDLVYGMVIQSGNDASVALAELVGGSQANFVELMNRCAKRLGLKNTNYTNVDGLTDPRHYTSVSDLSVLATHIIKDFPEYYSIHALKSFTYNNIWQPNRNRLLTLDPTVDGLKTGHTKEAGYCLVSSASRPLLNESGLTRRILSIVVGEPTEHARVQDSLLAINYAYQNFDTRRIYRANQVVAMPKLWKGKVGKLQVGTKHDQFITVPKGTADKIKSELEFHGPLIAPLTDGAIVGTIKVFTNGKKLTEFPVVALTGVVQAGILGRTWDSLRLMFIKK
ncbi:D-alanyl-D-alanine carboxypeptidase family protein [Candidatus Pandoraea novymonadis]|uniref:serine-type D-Ala-D-Ala carboxypeptidase n=1 Tax=Candidatus Pandoraea novymonadis TaxID=1808959 RepID=A0ABX5FD86_9BURK|nr:D-alanyl-D-alanine carboxypeptidase family protein [Candidatus Pandoraea novymonadis]PSB91733.1 D-alanyl-D-alanine carboxypeptidase DacA [Candidatus Pandoraea novymonadis]